MPDDTGTCPEEKDSSGEHGVVEDTELLARIVLRKMVGKDLVLTREAIKTDEFFKKNGWSFVRESFADMKVLLAERANSKGRNLSDHGYALVKTSDIRSMLDAEQKRQVCVIDDPQPGFPAHALGQKSRPLEEEDAREIRDDLLELFQKVRYPWKP